MRSILRAAIFDAAKLGAMRNLLEVFLDEDRDTLSPEEATAIAEADDWSKHNQHQHPREGWRPSNSPRSSTESGTPFDP
ncbi:MAG TPA: hypothetical protein DEH78_10000 [Solibacterales bacterium]|nr:hypothetical protein [Bryobacterales bacterium]